mmetsp:Transcript_24917/g.27572  ORF Transcript_24917/g.27572 Transcript_24917/m.27572 type:complete len:212 (+) Transcript_24917:65-700(+)
MALPWRHGARLNKHTTWHLVNAKDQVVGRLAARIAVVLQGKHKTTFQNACDEGDAVVVVNAEKVVFTGKKWKQKLYRHHSGWPGGLKEIPAHRMLSDKPEMVLWKAVYGMIPKDNRRKTRIERLKIYAGPEHNHASQLPGAPEIPREVELLEEDMHPVMHDDDPYKYNPDEAMLDPGPMPLDKPRRYKVEKVPVGWSVEKHGEGKPRKSDF